MAGNSAILLETEDLGQDSLLVSDPLPVTDTVDSAENSAVALESLILPKIEDLEGNVESLASN